MGRARWRPNRARISPCWAVPSIALRLINRSPAWRAVQHLDSMGEFLDAAGPRKTEEIMAESENYKKGTKIRRELMGAAMADKMATSVYDDPIMQKFGDYAREAVF